MSELYRFQCGSIIYTYTDARSPVTIGAVTYSPQPITRTAWKATLRDTEITITLPLTVEPALQYAITNPIGVFTVFVTKLDGSPLFSGRILSADYKPRKAIVAFKIQAISSVLSGEIPSRTCSPSCDHDLFDSECGIDKADFMIYIPKAEVTVSGVMLTHSAFQYKLDGQTEAPNGYWATGYIQIGEEVSYITKHSGNAVWLMSPFINANGASYSVYFGCAKTKSVCEHTFDNLVNFGGFPHVPTKNPVTQGY